MIEYVLGFAFHEGRVVLIQKTKPDWQRGKLNGVGGKIEPGESAEAAMIREFEEESGVEFRRWTHVITMDFDDARVHVFAGELPPEATPHTTTEEKIQVEHVADLAWKPILLNLIWLVPMCQLALANPGSAHLCVPRACRFFSVKTSK